MALLASTACGQQNVFKGEIKWTVPAENIPSAKAVLGLQDAEAKQEEVWFFDTAGQDLRKEHHLVLRARRDDKKTDSTVKLRLADATGTPGASSPQGKVELDWGEGAQSLSLSEDAEESEIPALEKVMGGNAAVKELFPTKAQQKLLAPALATLDWGQIKRYGPVKAQVWKNKVGKKAKVHLPGYDEVTAELWHLEKGASRRDILEISIKTEGTREQIKQRAEVFFNAVRKQLVGDTSKTGAVLDFFAPGK